MKLLVTAIALALLSGCTVFQDRDCSRVLIGKPDDQYKILRTRCTRYEETK